MSEGNPVTVPTLVVDGAPATPTGSHPAPDTPTLDAGGEWGAAIMNYFKGLGVDPTAAPAKDVGTKPHMGGGVAPFPLPITMVGAFGGSETFEDYDEWKAAAKRQDEIDSLAMIFDSLVQNIRNDPEMSLEAKATKIAAVAGELGTRVKRDTDAQVAEDEKALDEPATESFWFEAEDFSFTFQRDQAAAAEKAATKRDTVVELRASDFADVPDAKKPSTWKLPLVRGHSGGFDLGRIGDAVAAMQPSGQLGSSESRVVARIRAAIGRAPGEAGQKSELRARLAKVKAAADGGLFTVYKDADGRYRWLTVHSNAYKDRENESFAPESHDEYVRWVDADAKDRMPELRIFHVPGSKVGRADLVDHTTEGFMIASGRFEPGMEHVAERLTEWSKSTPLGCSHGFWFDPDAFHGGVYHRYRSFEVSVLPLAYAANETTGFIAGKEVPVLSPEKKAALVASGGEEWANTIETRLGEAAKDAEEKGIAYKDIEAATLKVLEGAAPPKTKDGEPDPNGTAPPEGAVTPNADGTVTLNAEALAPLAKGMADLAEAVTGIAATVKAQGEQLVALKEADAAKIAEAFRPRFDPTKGFSATQSKDSIVGADDPAVAAAAAQNSGGVPPEMSGYFNEDGSLRGFGGPAPAAAPVTAPTPPA